MQWVLSASWEERKSCSTCVDQHASVWATSAFRKASRVLLSREVACAIASDQCPSVVCLWLCCSAKSDGFRTPGLEQEIHQVAPEASSSGIA
ncbi:unnamed protein product [Urochloa humidicola]